MKKRGIVVGGGAFAREILCWAANAQNFAEMPPFKHFLDSNPKALADFPEVGLSYLGDILTYNPQPNDIFLLGVGDPEIKVRIVERLTALGAEFANIIHISAVLSTNARIGKGVIIGPHSYIATHSEIGNYTSINSLTGIGHDAKVGDFCTISSQVDVMGNVVICPQAFIGSGARIMPGVTIGHNSKIGAGALIVRSVRPDTTMFSAPARKF